MMLFLGGGMEEVAPVYKKSYLGVQASKSTYKSNFLGLSLWSTSLRSKSISMGGQCEPILVGGLTYIGSWVELYRMVKKAM